MTYKHVAGCIFLSPRRRILCVLGRASQKWSFPKGHLQDGETAYQCARRECIEETGIVPPLGCKKVVLLPTGTYFVFETSEFDCYPLDREEVATTAWLSVKQLRRISVNIDVNAFLTFHSHLFEAQSISTLSSQSRPRPFQWTDNDSDAWLITVS